MKNLFNVLAISQLEGGTYTVDTVLKVIKQITDKKYSFDKEQRKLNNMDLKTTIVVS